MNAKRRPALFPAALAGALLAACSSTTPAGGRPSRPGPGGAWAAAPLEQAVSVRDGRSGAGLELEALLDELAQAEAVFLGETHLDETTHRLELAVYEGLLERRPGRVVLALEMFERDVQPALDRYLAGETDEAEFLAATRPWSNYATAYRPLIEAARRAGARVRASNFPRPVMRSLMSSQPPSLEQLSAGERALAPAELLPNSAFYWRRVDNAIRGHMAAMGAPDPSPEARLFSTQSLWDNSMGESCALELERDPGCVVLHVNGGFHSEYWDGTVRQLLARRPATRVRTVAISPTANPAVVGFGGAARADFEVFAEARAADVDSGSFSVTVPRKLDYRLHVPAQASAAAPVPLLVWLSSDGLDSQDGLDLWVERLGESCAIAALDAPYRETQPDLGSGGRWFWKDSFSEDVSASTSAIERACGYIVRHHPIDTGRIVLAGEQGGASVAIAAALSLDQAPLAVLAWQPNALRSLKDLPLPLAELRGDLPPRETSMHILVPAGEREAWQPESEAYASVGVQVRLEAVAANPWETELQLERTLQAALGLPLTQPPPAGERLHVLAGTPRARQWARLAIAKRKPEQSVAIVPAAPADPDSTEFVLDVGPEQVREGAQLPRAPGAFGGTTLIVLPADAAPELVAAWRALEQEDPLTARSRFYRLRLASLAEGSDRHLSDVLALQVEEGRRNVLIVPATFCAEAETLRALASLAQPFAQDLDLTFRAGLGGL